MNRAVLGAMVLCIAIYAGAGFAQDAESPAEKPGANAPASTDPPSPAAPESKPAAEPDAPAIEPSAEDRLNDLLRRRNENPLIEPSKPEPSARRQKDPAAPAAIRGTNPSVDKVQLRREGAFVTMRRGRLVPADGGIAPWMFAFEADANGLADPPMYLMPCRLLEEMESAEQGRDSAVFLVSGQIYVYHGANYLLPTIMKLAPSRGNIEQ